MQRRSNTPLVLLVAAMFMAGSTACWDWGATTPRKVFVNPAFPRMTVGQTVQLKATVTGYQDQTVIWSSRDPTIDTVNTTGLVTGVAVGTATINPGHGVNLPQGLPEMVLFRVQLALVHRITSAGQGNAKSRCFNAAHLPGCRR
jgi:Bacterial Ig-like domain (group 2)